jgi:acetate---CoA ligase (ADP-forming) subunit beta
MLTDEMRSILSEAKAAGWLMEPQVKKLLSLAGVDVTRFIWARDADEAVGFAHSIGYPVVAKIVSPKVVHKSDIGGVVVGIGDDEGLIATFEKFRKIDGFAGMLVEEPLKGMEIIVGAKIDHQFGPVLLLGAGGTAVEIYKDVALRMIPVREEDIRSMVSGLKAHQLLEGYRGADPVDMEKLSDLLMNFSALVMDLGNMIASIDLNPVMCSSSRCVVADGRIMLNTASLP